MIFEKDQSNRFIWFTDGYNLLEKSLLPINFLKNQMFIWVGVRSHLRLCITLIRHQENEFIKP